MFAKRYPFFLVALVVVPLLSMATTTPVFLVLDNSLSILPFVWIMACLPLTLSWLFNYFIFNSVGGRVWLQLVITTSCMVVVSILVRYLLEDQMIAFIENVNGRQIKRLPPSLTTVGVVVMNNLLIVVFQTLVRYRLKEVQLVKELGEVKLLQIEAQYDNLKNQIHPHFLFNALNVLKILVYKDPAMAEEYILKVSDFLRASLQASKTTVLTVEEDLKIARNYLAIQEVRFKEGFQLSIDLPEAVMNRNIPILTFQCLFENALKHNKLSKQDPLLLFLSFKGEDVIEVRNTRRPLEARQIESTGTGLRNLSERFVLLRGKELRIFRTENTFEVQLTLLP
jgi:two-component system, LytTR family, sensor kinase